MQVQCMKQGTHSWCSGTTQRDGVGREVAERLRITGPRVHPWLMHVNVWQKPPQYCKVVSLQLKYLKKNQLDRPVCFTHENILLSYVNKTCICSEICLSSRFRSIVLWPGMTHLVPMLSQNNMLWVRGLVSVSEFSDISFL